MVSAAWASGCPMYFFVALYSARVGRRLLSEAEAAEAAEAEAEAAAEADAEAAEAAEAEAEAAAEADAEAEAEAALWGCTPCGLWNWHCLVSECSYSVRPSGNCVVFHFIASASCWAAAAVEADGRSGAELAIASLRRCWFST